MYGQQISVTYRLRRDRRFLFGPYQHMGIIMPVFNCRMWAGHYRHKCERETRRYSQAKSMRFNRLSMNINENNIDSSNMNISNLARSVSDYVFKQCFSGSLKSMELVKTI